VADSALELFHQIKPASHDPIALSVVHFSLSSSSAVDDCALPILSRKQPLVVLLIRARIFEDTKDFFPKILSRKALDICTHDARLVVFFVFSFCFWGFFVLFEEPLLLLCFLVSI
jgi:hypothetical protein